MIEAGIKFVIALLLSAVSFATNADNNLIVRIGLESNGLTITLASVLLAGLLAIRHSAWVGGSLLLLILANLPDSAINPIVRDAFAALFVAVLVIPFVQRHIE